MRLADRGFIEQAQMMLEKSGLTQEPYLLIELDLIYSSGMAARSKRESESEKGKKLASIKRRR